MKNDYLKTLEVNTDLNGSALLNEIVYNHLKRFSFNNLAVTLNPDKILDLSTEALFKKIVLENQGGYCFEHNKLIYEMLIELGIKADKKLARVVYNKDVDAGRTHRITIVEIQAKSFLVDVGFGPYTPNCMVPLNGELVTAPNGAEYRIEKKENKFELILTRDGQPFILYTFDEFKYQESDFNLANYYTNTHPDSKFVTGLVCSLKNANEAHFINLLTYTQVIEGKRTDEEITSALKLQKILDEKFYLKISNDESVFLFGKLTS